MPLFVKKTQKDVMPFILDLSLTHALSLQCPFLDFFRQLSTAFPACFTVERVNPKPQGLSTITLITSFCRKMGKKRRKKARCKKMELSRAFGDRYQQYVSDVPAACQQYVSGVPAACQQYVSGMPAVCRQHASRINDAAAVLQRYRAQYPGLRVELRARTCEKLGFFTYFF